MAREGPPHPPRVGDDGEGHDAQGIDAGAYYVEALPSCYLDADEPPGRWHGQGADLLGLRGEVRDVDFLDIMAGVHPGSRGVLRRRVEPRSS